MKRDLMKLLAVLLALALVLSLAACSKSDDGDDEDDREEREDRADREDQEGLSADKLQERQGPDPEEDPYGYLTEMTENTMEELSARYQGSPLSSIAEVLRDKGSLAFSTEIPEEGVGLSATLSYDLSAPAAVAEGSMTFEGQEITAGAYMDGDFWGVSVPMLFGNDTYYGFRPSGLYDQVANSVLGEAMDPEALEAFRQIDDLLGILRDLPAFDFEAARAHWQELMDQTIQSMDLTAAKASGQEKEGWVITGEMDSAALADNLETLFDEFMNAGIWDVMDELAQAVGEEFDLGIDTEEMEEAFQDIRDADISCRYQWYTLDERLVKVVITAVDVDGSEAAMTVNFFDDNAVTVSVEDRNSGEQVLLNSSVSNQDGYAHTVTLVTPEGDQIDLTASWTGSGLLTLTMAQEGDYVTLTTDLTVSDNGFTLGDFKGVSNLESEDLDIPMSLTYTSGGTVTAPADRANFFELSEDEMVDLVTNIQEALE